MNVVVLGGTGYIGREVTQKLINMVEDVKITVVSRKGEGGINAP